MNSELDHLEIRLQALEAQIMTLGDDQHISSRLTNLEKTVAILEKLDDAATVKAVNQLRKEMNQVLPHLAASSIPGCTALEARVIDLITSAFADIAKADDRKTARELADIRTDFNSLATGINATQKQLQALANANVEHAALRLQEEARTWASDPVSKVLGSPTARGPIEAYILAGAQ